jgi:hypothetical protein
MPRRTATSTELTIEDARRLLERALARFKEDYVADGGRSGMLDALQGVLAYMTLSLPAGDIEFLKPIFHLERALHNLDRTGTTALCFQGRNPGHADSDLVLTMKARALAASDLIKTILRCSRDKADKITATLFGDVAGAMGLNVWSKPESKKPTQLPSWRRGTRNRGSKGAALADHIEDARREIGRKLGKARQWNGDVCTINVDELIRDLLAHPITCDWPD